MCQCEAHVLTYLVKRIVGQWGARPYGCYSRDPTHLLTVSYLSDWSELLFNTARLQNVLGKGIDMRNVAALKNAVKLLSASVSGESHSKFLLPRPQKHRINIPTDVAELVG